MGDARKICVFIIGILIQHIRGLHVGCRYQNTFSVTPFGKQIITLHVLSEKTAYLNTNGKFNVNTSINFKRQECGRFDFEMPQNINVKLESIGCRVKFAEYDSLTDSAIIYLQITHLLVQPISHRKLIKS